MAALFNVKGVNRFNMKVLVNMKAVTFNIQGGCPIQ